MEEGKRRERMKVGRGRQDKEKGGKGAARKRGEKTEMKGREIEGNRAEEVV